MSPVPSRRAFLKRTTAAAALAALPIARGAHAAGGEVIRIGMIGCGGRCTGAAVDAMDADPGVRLVAMCDLFADRVENKRKALKAQKPSQVEVDDAHCFAGFDGYKQVIASAEVVLIACAAKFHPLYLRAALEAGKHVFVEKPHAIDPPGCRQVLAAGELARQKGLCVVSGLQSRYQPSYQEAIARIHDGQIGDVVAIEENFLRGPYGLVKRVPGLNEVQYQCSNQYHFTWLSGDDVPQSLVHNIDRATWVMREAHPVKCHGLAGRSSSFDEIYGNVFDHHSVVYEYANGVRMYAFCRTQNGCYNEVSSVILGSRGRCFLFQGRIEGEKPWTFKGQTQSPYKLEHKALFAAIRAGKPIVNTDYMAKSTLATVMGQLSCYSGKEMRWDAVEKSDFAFAPKPEECSFQMPPPVSPENGVYPVPLPGLTRFAI